jgi:hypothetical protein
MVPKAERRQRLKNVSKKTGLKEALQNPGCPEVQSDKPQALTFSYPLQACTPVAKKTELL